LVVVISIIAVLAGIFLNRVWFYQEMAEKAAMEQVAGALQSALTLQYGSLLTHGKEGEANQLATKNPMSWLAKKPVNYAGEFFDPTPQAVAAGNWFFDLKSRELVYLVDHGEYFTPGKDGNKWVRYRVNLLYESMLAEGEKGRKILVGVVLAPTESYHWLERTP
jgi:hypothetical protein